MLSMMKGKVGARNKYFNLIFYFLFWREKKYIYIYIYIKEIKSMM